MFTILGYVIQSIEYPKTTLVLCHLNFPLSDFPLDVIVLTICHATSTERCLSCKVISCIY